MHARDFVSRFSAVPRRFPWLILVFLLLLSSGCGKEKKERASPEISRPVKLLTVGGPSAGRTLRMSGEVRAAERADLSFRVPGLIVEMAVEEGQRVAAGQLLARLDPEDYRSRLRNAQGRLAKAKAKLRYDAAEYRRYRKIRQAEPGAVSESLLNLKRAALAMARAEVQSAEAAVAEAREQLAHTRLEAPFAGVVGRRYVDAFEFVTANRPVIHLQNFETLEILLDLPERMVMPIRRVNPRFFAEFAAAPGERHPLTIKAFATQADPLTQTYRMVLQTLAPANIRILPGMTATVVIELPPDAALDADITVPTVALFTDPDGRSCVWVVDPDTRRVHKRVVTTGRLTGRDRIEIRAGLKAGETIAVSGVSHLQEGMTVRPYGHEGGEVS